MLYISVYLDPYIMYICWNLLSVSWRVIPSGFHPVFDSFIGTVTVRGRGYDIAWYHQGTKHVTANYAHVVGRKLAIGHEPNNHYSFEHEIVSAEILSLGIVRLVLQMEYVDNCWYMLTFNDVLLSDMILILDETHQSYSISSRVTRPLPTATFQVGFHAERGRWEVELQGAMPMVDLFKVVAWLLLAWPSIGFVWV